MKTLILKLLALTIPIAAAVVALAVHIDRSPALRKGVFNADVDGKFNALVTPDVEIVIAGDSRGERQLMPRVIEQRTGYKTVNVATSSCDLITLANAIDRHVLPPRTRALIVSTSIFQVNDGATERGYLSRAAVLNMTWPEKLVVHRSMLRYLLQEMVAVSLRREGNPLPLDAGRRRELGFLAIGGRLELPLKTELARHPWYRDVSLHGARWRIFREALQRLAAHNVPIYLIQSPVSPAWRAYTAGTYVDRSEREFTQMLRDEAAKYPNVHLLDFYSTPDSRLGNDRFYDIQHLNCAGAAIFTGMVIEQVFR